MLYNMSTMYRKCTVRKEKMTLQNYRFIPIHELASAIGPVKSSGLLMFHALTGCDTTSFFNGIGKKTAWSTWKKYTDADQVFKDLSLPDSEIDQCKTELFLTYFYLYSLYYKLAKAKAKKAQTS